MSFSPGKAGTPKKPVATGVTQVLTATGTNGNRAAPLTDLKSTIYGLKYDSAAVKATCSFASVKAISNDKNCPKGSLVATANVHALLGPANDPSYGRHGHHRLQARVSACGTRVAASWCSSSGPRPCPAPCTTAVASRPVQRRRTRARSRTHGQEPRDRRAAAVVRVEQGPRIGRRGARSIAETITWKKLSSKSHGKTHYFVSSIGCKSGKRPWTQQFTADFTNPADTGGTIQSFTATGSAKCK